MVKKEIYVKSVLSLWFAKNYGQLGPGNKKNKSPLPYTLFTMLQYIITFLSLLCRAITITIAK